MRAISSRVKVSVGAVVLVAVGLVMPNGEATFPGQNGKIAWTEGGNIRNALPDGSTPASVPNPLVLNADHAAWSVDGVWIVVDRLLTAQHDIVKAFADGSAPTNITNSAADDIQPSWAPDNVRVVFASNRTGNQFRIFHMNNDGSDIKALTLSDGLAAGFEDGAPEWSPDGKRVVFQRGDGSGGTRIYTVKSDGTDLKPISGTSSPDGKAYNKLVNPKYSPNGTKVVFEAQATGCDSRLFVMDSDTGANLAFVSKIGACVVAEPTWSPDGKILLFRASGGTLASDGLYGLQLSDNTFAKLGPAGGSSPDWEPLGGLPVTVFTTTSTSTTPVSTSSTSSTTSTTVVAPVDKKARPMVVRNGRWYLRNTQTTGNADLAFDYGNPTGDIPVTGDWDGNGSVTPGVVRAGTWFLRNTNTAGVADLSFAYGNPGDIAVAGDWDGNGTVTPGVVRAGTWYLRNSNTTGVADITFVYGNSGDIPIVGDWDGNNSTTPGVLRGGTWYLRNSNTTGNADTTFGFGDAGDAPLRWRSA